MDAPSSTLKPSDSALSTSGVSKFLQNLPSRGLFSSNTISSNPCLGIEMVYRFPYGADIPLSEDSIMITFDRKGILRVYVCDHDTAPPEEQLIKTDQTNILIRALKLKNNKAGSKSPSRESSRKRAPEKALDGRAKRAGSVTGSQSSSRHEALNSGPPIKVYHNLTVERLRALLKERSLSVRGKKDELITRLREADN